MASAIFTPLRSLTKRFVSQRPQFRVVVTRDFGPQLLGSLRRPDIDLIVWSENRICDKQWLIDNAPGAHGIFCLLTDTIDKSVIEAAGPTLRIISTMSVGTDHIDLATSAQRGIRVGCTPGAVTEAVADLSVMLALMASRSAGDGFLTVHNGEWPTAKLGMFSYCGPQISTSPHSPSRTVGFLGFGRIAQATLARLVPFGITDVIYSGNPATTTSYAERDAGILKANPTLKTLKRVDLDTLAKESDILFAITPGGKETYHLINEEFLKKMKKQAVFVNTGRGTTVDSEALAKALREEWIYAAGLDVVEGEPKIHADHPLVQAPRCIVLPHIATATMDTRIGMGIFAVRNLLSGLGLSQEEMPGELDLSRFK